MRRHFKITRTPQIHALQIEVVDFRLENKPTDKVNEKEKVIQHPRRKRIRKKDPPPKSNIPEAQKETWLPKKPSKQRYSKRPSIG